MVLFVLVLGVERVFMHLLALSREPAWCCFVLHFRVLLIFRHLFKLPSRFLFHSFVGLKCFDRILLSLYFSGDILKPPVICDYWFSPQHICVLFQKMFAVLAQTSGTQYRVTSDDLTMIVQDDRRFRCCMRQKTKHFFLETPAIINLPISTFDSPRVRSEEQWGVYQKCTRIKFYSRAEKLPIYESADAVLEIRYDSPFIPNRCMISQKKKENTQTANNEWFIEGECSKTILRISLSLSPTHIEDVNDEFHFFSA